MGCAIKEDVMSTIKAVRSRGASNSTTAGCVNLSSGTVRYHVRRLDARDRTARYRSRRRVWDGVANMRSVR